MDGIICVNKPQGITSFDVVRKLKRILKERRIGHTGTLDPMATGVMIVCVGRATKLVQDIESHEKEYLASFHLGYKTDTYDTEGTVTDKSEIEKPNENILRDTLSTFLGDIKQVPPMYSALKIDGKRLYDLARQGITVERKARDVKISSLELKEYDGESGKFLCKVSKGTYIRSLIFDLGEKLGTFATMTGLVRTEVGDINLERCFTLEDMENMAEKGDLSFLQGVEGFFGYPKLELVGEENLKYYKNGNNFSCIGDDGHYSIYYKDEFIGLATIKNNRIQSYKYF
ncbi:MAG: tRNA pseudouridine(55) synthase TruB [Fusobacteriaceae bacterium]